MKKLYNADYDRLIPLVEGAIRFENKFLSTETVLTIVYRVHHLKIGLNYRKKKPCYNISISHYGNTNEDVINSIEFQYAVNSSLFL